MTRFEFSSTQALEWLLEQIGDLKHHLRTLILDLAELDGRALPAGKRAIKALLPTKNIRTLAIRGDCYLYDGYNMDFVKGNASEYAWKFAKMCTPLLRSLEEFFKADNLGTNVLDVLKITSGNKSFDLCRTKCDHVRCIEWRTEWEERFDQMEAAMRKEAASQLNIDYQ